MTTASDREFVEGAGCRAPLNIDVRHRGACRTNGECMGETLECTPWPFRRCLNGPVWLVRDPSAEAKAQSFPSGEIPEPDSLDETFDPHLDPHLCLRGVGFAQGVGPVHPWVAG